MTATDKWQYVILAISVIAQAPATDPSVEAEARYWLGRLNERVGDYKRGEESLRRAALAAEGVRDDELAANAWVDLAFLVGVQMCGREFSYLAARARAGGDAWGEAEGHPARASSRPDGSMANGSRDVESGLLGSRRRCTGASGSDRGVGNRRDRVLDGGAQSEVLQVQKRNVEARRSA